MEATAAGLTTGTLGAFTVVPGTAAQVALTAPTSDLVSGSTRLLTATVQDAAGNTIIGDNSTVVTFAQVSGAGTVTGLAGSETVSGGVATKTVTGELAGSVNLEASASGLTTGARSFDVVHGAAYKVTLSAPITDLASGASRVITATVRDAAGNRVTNDNSTVSLSPRPPAPAPSPASAPTPPRQASPRRRSPACSPARSRSRAARRASSPTISASPSSTAPRPRSR